MSKTRGRLPAIHCPHCGERSIVRDSVAVTDMVRELRLNCMNDECGHTFVAQLSIVRTIRPAARPKLSVNLPFGEWRKRPANDDVPDAANDTEAPPLPATDIMTG